MFFGLSNKALSAIAASVVLVGVVIGTAAVLADGDDFGTVEGPQWQSGYAWTYDVSGGMDYAFSSEDIGQDSGSVDFGSFSIKKEVLNTGDYSFQGDALYIGATTLPLGHILGLDMFDLDAGHWSNLAVFPTADRQSDLAPIPAYPIVNSDGEAVDIGFYEGLGVDYINFPLEADKRWSETVSFQDRIPGMEELEEFGDITELQLVGEVGTMESIDLPIGTTEAVRIDFSYKPIGLQQAVADFREEAEAYGVTVERLNMQLGLHEIAHYSPEHQTIVRDQYILRGLIDISLHAGGEHYEGFAEMTSYVLSELTGSSLATVSEHSHQEVMDKLNGREAIRDPEGAVIAPEDLYHISVSQSTDTVNAAEGESVSFTVANDAEDGLPAGHRLEYVVLDAEGRVSDVGGAASQFSIGFDEPGAYTVKVAAVDGDGNAISQDRAYVTANYLATSYAQCGAGSDLIAFTSPECGGISVPARAGLDHATLTVRLNETLDIFGQDHIELIDAAGRSILGYYNGDSYVIELDGDDIAQDADDGALYFRSYASLGSDLSFTVDLTYGAPAIEYMSISEPAGGLKADWTILGGMLSYMDGVASDVVAGEQPVLGLDGLL